MRKQSEPGVSTRLGAQGRCGRDLLRAVGMSDSAIGTYWYRKRPLSSEQEQLCKRLRELSEAHPRYGYRRIAVLLRQEAWRVGKRQVQRLRSGRRSASPAKQAQGGPSWRFEGLARQSHASGACLDLGLHRRCHGTRRGVKDADDTG